MKKSFLTLLTVLGGTLLILVFFRAGSYPAATINGEMLLRGDYDLSYAAAKRFYENSFKAYGQSEQPVDPAQFSQELSRASLDSLIESLLIRQGLYQALGEGKAKNLVNEKLAAAQTSEVSAEKIQTLYGLSLKDFSRIVLVPTAEKELLLKELQRQNISFDAWIAEQRLNAKVDLFLPEFAWQNGAVALAE